MEHIAPRSLKPGAAVLDRAVANVAAAMADPTTINDAQAWTAPQYQAIDVVMAVEAGTTCDAYVWRYYADADTWVLDTSFGTAGKTSITGGTNVALTVALGALSGLYVQFKNFAGGGRARAWVIGVF